MGMGIPQIFEQGLNPETHQWASDYLFLNEGFVNVTIPSCIEAGQYLLRVESICQFPLPARQLFNLSSDTNLTPA